MCDVVSLQENMHVTAKKAWLTYWHACTDSHVKTSCLLVKWDKVYFTLNSIIMQHSSEKVGRGCIAVMLV